MTRADRWLSDSRLSRIASDNHCWLLSIGRLIAE
jgi:hypothetical protein